MSGDTNPRPCPPAAEPEWMARAADDLAQRAEYAERSPFHLPPEFWNARPDLQQIRQAALSRPCSPDAVLGAVLARVAVAHPPSIQLPRGATLNCAVVVVGPSGAGKGVAIDAAADLLPLDHRTDLDVDVPIGSGEGIPDTYLGAARKTGDGATVRDIVRTGALFQIDEGQVLADLGSRSGSTLLPTIRTACDGRTLGNRNANKDRDRRVPKGRYRFAVVIGIQPHHAGGILRDAPGGTPQRLIWLPASYPPIAALDRLPAWPGELDLPTPTTTAGEILEIDDVVAAEIEANRIGALAGIRVVDELDSHRDLVRLKTAALLGLLDQRRSVSAEDWSLAGQVLRTSDVTRAIILEDLRAQQRAEDERRIRRRVAETTAVADTEEERAVRGGARAMARRVHRTAAEDLPLVRRDLQRAPAGKHAAAASIDDMIARALHEGWISEETEHDGTTAYLPGGSQPA